MNEHKLSDWRTSSYSGDGNSCVEVGPVKVGGARRDGAASVIGVRDTKRNGRGPVLEFGPAAWREFLSRIR